MILFPKETIKTIIINKINATSGPNIGFCLNFNTFKTFSKIFSINKIIYF